MNVPYKHHGRDEYGLDCYGLIIAIYSCFGIKLLDINDNYDEHWSWQGRDYFAENYHKQWEIVSNPSPLDVVMFKNKKGIVNHGGIVIDRFRFVNARKAGVVIDKLGSEKWKKSIDNFYRFKR